MKTDGTIRCWGANKLGQIGDGTTSPHPTPVLVPNASSVAELGLGQQHTCARMTDGTAACWGDNGVGQLGATSACGGGSNSYATPKAVAGIASLVGLGLGSAHSCAVKKDGSASCWGNNAEGELGATPGASCLGTASAVPLVVSGLSSVVAIAGYGGHACALKSDGTVSCWGGNFFGQLGTPSSDTCGSQACSKTPVAVKGLSGVAQLAQGSTSAHTCVRKMDGTVLCWGINNYGQLGVKSNDTCGNQPCSQTPIVVAGLSSVADIAVGNSHTCALKTDGTVLCWGWNGQGQLGDGTTINHASPTPVKW